MSEEKSVKSRFPLKSFNILGETGIGVDFYSNAFKSIISLGFRYSGGLTNSKGSANNIYNNTIDKLKRESITFTVNFRG